MLLRHVASRLIWHDASGALAQLTFLNLGENQIGDSGIKALADAVSSGALASLERVVLDGNPGDSAPVNKALRERKK